MDNNRGRILYIDIARGIGILLVILGHCIFNTESFVRTFIYSFHMPFFFMLSGMTYKPVVCDTMSNTMKQSLKKKRFLLLVYAIFSTVFLLKDVVIGAFSENIIWIIINEGYSTLLFDGINVLWFVSTLIVTEVLFDFCRFVFKKTKNLMGGLAFLSAGAVMISVCIQPMIQSRLLLVPFRVLMRPLSMVCFFGAGVFFTQKNTFGRLVEQIKKSNTVYVFISILTIAGAFLAKNNGIVDVHNLYYGENFILFFITSFYFSIALILLSIEIERFKKISNLIMFMGRNSLFIMLTHNYFGMIEMCHICFHKMESFSDYLSFCVVLVIEYLLVKIIGEKIIMVLKRI